MLVVVVVMVVVVVVVVVVVARGAPSPEVQKIDTRGAQDVNGKRY